MSRPSDTRNRFDFGRIAFHKPSRSPASVAFGFEHYPPSKEFARRAVILLEEALRSVNGGMVTRWYESEGLDREVVFAWMREQTVEELRLEARSRSLSPRPGEIAVGSAAFDPFLESEVIRGYLRVLREGGTPEKALEGAKEAGRFAISRHNEKRTDVNWRRWEGSGDGIADRLHVHLLSRISSHG